MQKSVIDYYRRELPKADKLFNDKVNALYKKHIFHYECEHPEFASLPVSERIKICDALKKKARVEALNDLQ